MKKIHVSRQLMTAVLLSVMTVPFATMQAMSAAASSLPKGVISEEMRARVQEYENDVRERRQAYFKAVDDCQDEINRTKIKKQCPIFSDISTYVDYLPENSKYRFKGSGELSGSAAVLADIAERQAEREQKERALLREYIKKGYCPLSIKKFSLNGFYDLCVRMVKKGGVNPVGLANEKASLNPEGTYKVDTLKDRLEMLRQAHDRSTRRTNMQVGQSSSSSDSSAEQE